MVDQSEDQHVWLVAETLSPTLLDEVELGLLLGGENEVGRQRELEACAHELRKH